MLSFLNGIPAKLKVLSDRLTATWAAKLDTLHDTRLTSARAGYLDKLNISGVVAGAADVAAVEDITARTDDPLLVPPISLGCATTGVSVPTMYYYGGQTLGTLSEASAEADVYTVTGAGVVTGLLGTETKTATTGVTWRVYIDEVLVATVINTGTTGTRYMDFVGSIAYVTSGGFSMLNIGRVPFRSSLRVTVQAASSITGTFSLYGRVDRTA